MGIRVALKKDRRSYIGDCEVEVTRCQFHLGKKLQQLFFEYRIQRHDVLGKIIEIFTPVELVSREIGSVDGSKYRPAGQYRDAPVATTMDGSLAVKLGELNFGESLI